jgi:hypothetical protein
MRAVLKVALEAVLEFARVANELHHAEAILHKMDLSDEAWDDAIYHLKEFYTDLTGEYFHGKGG